jgi:tRNA-specific 2-thiouridylase
MKPRVVVAMSGGVDSSVAAALLHEQGYDVVGIAMRLASHDARSQSSRRSCCSYEDFEDARRVSELMGFPFYVIDLRDDFAQRVINPFVDEYLAGRTPNPCLMCNRDIKFDRLWSRAQALNADFVATGHYARIERDRDRGFRLLRAEDTSKDQSYFLFTLGQEELSRTLFPLGSMSKRDVRARARVLGLANADKPESQEICFVPDGDYADFVERRAAASRIKAGVVVDENDTVLAPHSGIHKFTIGQRRGLGVSSPAPLYVKKIDPESGRVSVAARSRLNARGLAASSVRICHPAIYDRATRDAQRIQVKIRYRHPAIPAYLKLMHASRAEVRFDSEYPAVTPGQACVFYDRDEVLGGGFIDRALEN